MFSKWFVSSYTQPVFCNAIMMLENTGGEIKCVQQGACTLSRTFTNENHQHTNFKISLLFYSFISLSPSILPKSLLGIRPWEDGSLLWILKIGSLYTSQKDIIHSSIHSLFPHLQKSTESWCYHVSNKGLHHSVFLLLFRVHRLRNPLTGKLQ